MKIIENYKNTESAYKVISNKNWPVVSIFSWIHWNEKSWIIAVWKFLSQIKSNEISIDKWSIIFVEWANKKAIEQIKRSVKDNLNRLFIDNLEWSWYEYYRSRELIWLLQESNYLLDLHSTPWPSIPFLFSEMSNFHFAKELWVSHIIWWWNDLGDSSTIWDSENYMNKLGWIWFTFESWDHNSPEWEKNAYQVILNTLSRLWMIDEEYFTPISHKKNYLKVVDVYVCKSWKFEFKIQNLENFSSITKGTLIWLDWNEEVRAEEDMLLVMPHIWNFKKWQEIFFVGKELCI